MGLCYNFMAFLALHLPRGTALLLVRIITYLQYRANPVMRRRVRRNLRIVLNSIARARDAEKLESMVRETYYNFGLYIYEFLLIPRIDRNFVRDKIEIQGLDNLEAAFRKKKGVVSLTGHLGNWELAGIVTALLGYPINAVALPHKSSALNRFFMHRRQIKGIKVIPLGKQTRRLISALRRNELVALLGDRTFGPPYLELNFFGRKALLPAGPAELSTRLGCPLVPGFLIRENNRLSLCFEKPLEAETDQDIPTAVKNLAQRSVVYLEKHISAHPTQWLVFDNAIWLN